MPIHIVDIKKSKLKPLKIATTRRTLQNCILCCATDDSIQRMAQRVQGKSKRSFSFIYLAYASKNRFARCSFQFADAFTFDLKLPHCCVLVETVQNVMLTIYSFRLFGWFWSIIYLYIDIIAAPKLGRKLANIPDDRRPYENQRKNEKIMRKPLIFADAKKYQSR